MTSKTNGKFTDEQLVGMICGSAEERERALHFLFVHSGWREEALTQLQRRGAGWQDAKDAVQEAFITLDKQVRSGGFEKGRSLKAYFWGVCEGRIYSYKRGKKRVENGSEAPVMVEDETPESELLKAERKNMIRKALWRLDDRCRDLLTRYMLSFSMKEIREQLNIVSEGMTRKIAFDCRQKLAALIDNHPSLRRYLKNEPE